MRSNTARPFSLQQTASPSIRQDPVLRHYLVAFGLSPLPPIRASEATVTRAGGAIKDARTSLRNRQPERQPSPQAEDCSPACSASRSRPRGTPEACLEASPEFPSSRRASMDRRSLASLSFCCAASKVLKSKTIIASVKCSLTKIGASRPSASDRCGNFGDKDFFLLIAGSISAALCDEPRDEIDIPPGCSAATKRSSKFPAELEPRRSAASKKRANCGSADLWLGLLVFAAIYLRRCRTKEVTMSPIRKLTRSEG